MKINEFDFVEKFVLPKLNELKSKSISKFEIVEEKIIEIGGTKR